MIRLSISLPGPAGLPEQLRTCQSCLLVSTVAGELGREFGGVGGREFGGGERGEGMWKITVGRGQSEEGGVCRERLEVVE